MVLKYCIVFMPYFSILKMIQFQTLAISRTSETVKGLNYQEAQVQALE